MHGAIAAQQIAAPPLGGIALVQKKARVLNTAPSGGAMSTTFDTAPTAGNLLVLAIGSAASGGTPSVALPAGWSMLMHRDAQNGSPAGALDRWVLAAYKIAGASEPATVTVTVTGSTNPADMALLEYSGVAPGAPRDRSVDVASGPGNVTSFNLGTTPATGQADELALAFCCIANRSGQALSDGFTLETVDTSRIMVGTKILAASGAVTCTASWSVAVTAVGGIFTFRGLAGAPAPALLTGLVAWFDASDLATITASAGKVSQWADKSPLALPVVMATSSRQPATGTRTINGRNVLDFDGSDDNLWNLSYPTSRAAPATWLAVYQLDVTTNGQTLWDAYTTYRTTLGQKNIWSGTDVNLGAPTLNVEQVCIIQNGASSQAWINRTSVGTGTLGADAIQIPPSYFMVGENRGDGGRMNGVLAELVLASGAISAGDRAAWDAYCTTKWGTP